jgi:hypothetical protein
VLVCKGVIGVVLADACDRAGLRRKQQDDNGNGSAEIRAGERLEQKDIADNISS